MARPHPEQIKSRLAEIDRRYKRRRKGGRSRPFSIAALRVRDLERLFESRYGTTLPDDDAGRDDARLMAHHLAGYASNPIRRVESWIAAHAPWMHVGELKALIAEVAAEPQRWRADKLAWRVRLTEREREALGITTIGAIDMSKAERVKRRRQRAKTRAEAHRRKHGIKPRAQYLSATIGRPWIAAGISRAKWYRQRAKEP